MESKFDVGLLTCSQFPRLQKDYIPLLEHFESMNLLALPIVWDDANFDWKNVKNLIFCSAWDYHKDYTKFNHWLNKIEQITNVINSPEIVRWNIDKSYLRHFENCDIPVINTTWLDKNFKEDTLNKLNMEEIVVKPAVGAGSSGMKKFALSTQKESFNSHIRNLLKHSLVMIQPYMESADKIGETALLYFDGHFSHAVSRPIAGHMGTPDEEVASASYIEPTSIQSSIGKKVIESLPFNPAYLRVDLIKDDHGRDLVLEAEMIEPTLFFEQYPQSVTTYANILKNKYFQ